MGDKVIALANAEDLPAHGEAIAARLDRAIGLTLGAASPRH